MTVDEFEYQFAPVPFGLAVKQTNVRSARFA